MSRTKIAKLFSKYMSTKENRPMDEICKPNEGGFALQIHQKFLKEWMKKTPDFKHLLLYHEIGSGKTCTAITMAEEYMKMNPSGSVLVILPARLRTNFYDEMLSPCSEFKYISENDYHMLFDASVSQKMKKAIKDTFRKKVNERYTIWSFEKFKMEALKQPNVMTWIKSVTSNKMVIIDEVHNLISTGYKKYHFEILENEGGFNTNEYVKGTYTMLLKALSMYAASSCKFLMLSATPVFDKMSQFGELVSIMTDKKMKTPVSLAELIEKLRGKVSYFPGVSKNAYPAVLFETERVKASETQVNVMKKIKENAIIDDYGHVPNNFMALSRQASVAVMPGKKPLVVTPEKLEEVVENLGEYAPKVKLLLARLVKLKGKQLVYSSFVKLGVSLISKVLEKAGFVNFLDVIKGTKQHSDYKVYAIWDGSTQDKDKEVIKAGINSINNLDGKYIKIVIGSPSIKEGISFKHVQHMHILDPVWNQSAKSQIEGRAIRFCSHVDIKSNHNVLKRQVIIHVYRMFTSNDNLETSDEIIYDKVIPGKYQLVKEAEEALKKVAIDYYLFRGLYKDGNLSPLKQVTGEQASPLDLDTDTKVYNKSTYSKPHNLCPKPRRPINGLCKPGRYLDYNNQGYACCYKIKGPAKEKKHCPVKRRPVNDKCGEGKTLRANKHGEACCYKITKKIASE